MIFSMLLKCLDAASPRVSVQQHDIICTCTSTHMNEAEARCPIVM